MNSNAEKIAYLIDYIESRLDREISLDELAAQVGYSKYHLHRMFTGMTGLSVHHYIRRRRLTEAARKLLFTRNDILDIALEAGYESQQAFTLAFKQMYKKSPMVFRKKQEFYPIQLKFCVEDNPLKLKGDRIMDIRTVERGPIHLTGFSGNTRRGFFVIPGLWRKLHRAKMKIPNRTDRDFLVGLNDYTEMSFEDNQPGFTYFAAAEVSEPSGPAFPKMRNITLPAGKYIVFSFRGNPKDSLQPVAEYIYRVWFPQSGCRLNEQARYDFARYGEVPDEKGLCSIEFWVPIL